MNNTYIPKLVRAAINNDRKNIEAIALLIGKKLKKEDPEVSSEIMKILSYTNSGSNVMRSIDISPIPVDHETRNQLAKIDEPIPVEPPILTDNVYTQLEDFLMERNCIERFLEESIMPPNSILLYGKPGVGKTYVAKWISYKLNMPMITLDLANSISSYLGRSGQNIKSIFQYTKEQNVVLFLDEMDAIAKRRDDASDLGELKRLVNVLLKELEDCPYNCIIIGATNHPELLDKAIWRRFDRSIEVQMPQEKERKALIHRELNKWLANADENVVELLCKQTMNLSAAEICNMCEHIKRRIILKPNETVNTCILKEYCEYTKIDTRESKVHICKILKQFDGKITIKNISELTGIPQASVARYLKE